MIKKDLVSASQTATTGGRKFDGGKLQYGLLPPLALKATVDALQRHLWAWKEGEQMDTESGKHHLAHALCCLMFLYEHDILYSIDKT